MFYFLLSPFLQEILIYKSILLVLKIESGLAYTHLSYNDKFSALLPKDDRLLNLLSFDLTYANIVKNPALYYESTLLIWLDCQAFCYTCKGGKC